MSRHRKPLSEEEIQARRESLHASCDGCGAPGIKHPGRGVGEHLCPRCVKLYLLDDAAGEHLRDLVAPIVKAWLEYWGQVVVDERALRDLAEVALSGFLIEEYED